MICMLLLINTIEYTRATLLTPWSLTMLLLLLIVAYLVNWTSNKVDKFLKGDSDE